MEADQDSMNTPKRRATTSSMLNFGEQNEIENIKSENELIKSQLTKVMGLVKEKLGKIK